jgi:hypothetical protein
VTPLIASHLQYLRDNLCQEIPVLRDDGSSIVVLLIEDNGDPLPIRIDERYLEQLDPDGRTH